MPRFSQRQYIVIGAVAAIAVFLFVLIYINARQVGSNSGKAALTVWGPQPRDNFIALISAYTTLHSNVTVSYIEIPETGYRDKLLTALAAGNGPDAFVIGNHDLPQLKSVLAPAPDTLTLVQYQNEFPEVVQEDFVSNGKIYASPLYIDTLAMIYNKDIVNSAGIALMPTTWNDFDAAIPALRLMNGNTISRAAAALGGTEKTIDNGMDALFLLMLQNGAQMTDSSHQSATFTQGENSPGISAFNFYLQFANPASSLYTWDETAGQNSLDSFAAGKTAILFDYKSALSVIKAKSPFLNAGVALVPQPAGAATRIDYAKYDGLAVAKASQNSQWAWDFVVFATANADGVTPYLTASHESPALRRVIADKVSDPEFSVFAKQALTAKSWYDIDDAKVRAIMNTAVTSVLTGKSDPNAAFRSAEAQVSQLLAAPQ